MITLQLVSLRSYLDYPEVVRCLPFSVMAQSLKDIILYEINSHFRSNFALNLSLIYYEHDFLLPQAKTMTGIQYSDPIKLRGYL
jgi:hypothetical protein